MAKTGVPPEVVREHARLRCLRYRAAHPDRVRARSAAYEAAHLERFREIRANYRKANAQVLRERRRKRYASRPERDNASSARYYAANRDKILAHHAEYRRENAQRIGEYEKRHRMVCPEVHRAQLSRRRARQASAQGRGLTAEQWRGLLRLSLGLCSWCGQHRRLTLDHIVALSAGGEHDIENIAAACGSCNSSKGDTPLIVWLAQRRKPPELDEFRKVG